MLSSKHTNPPALPTSGQQITLSLGAFNQQLLSCGYSGSGIQQSGSSGLPAGLPRSSTAGPSQGFTWDVGQGSGLIWGLGEEGSTSKFIWLLAGFSPCEQQNEGPQLPVAWTQPLVVCHLAICNVLWRGKRRSQQGRETLIQKLRPCVTSSQKGHHDSSATFCWLEASLRSLPYTGQGIRELIPEVQNIRRQLGV